MSPLVNSFEVRTHEAQAQQSQADFAATPLAGTSPLTVTFTDLSQNDPTGWSWDLGDGATSKEQHPTHVYTETGTYTVTLTASNALDADTLVMQAGSIVQSGRLDDLRREPANDFVREFVADLEARGSQA